MFIRLLPIILAGLIFSAHLLRIYGVYPAILSLLFMVLLFIKNSWIRRLWQIYLVFATLVWINATVGFVQYRMATGMPWVRLIIIMGLIIALTVFSIFRLENKKVKEFYDTTPTKSEE